jgi:hypothetical protein
MGVDWVAIAHPQTNGQVERANGMILQGLKPRIFNGLNKCGRKWLQELSSVIWSLRATPSRATGLTPFVTPGFMGKFECKNTCAPGSSYTHASTQCIPKHSVKRKESIKHLLHDRMSQLTIVRVANSGKETHAEVLRRQLTEERTPRTHRIV